MTRNVTPTKYCESATRRGENMEAEGRCEAQSDGAGELSGLSCKTPRFDLSQAPVWPNPMAVSARVRVPD